MVRHSARAVPAREGAGVPRRRDAGHLRVPRRCSSACRKSTSCARAASRTGCASPPRTTRTYPRSATSCPSQPNRSTSWSCPMRSSSQREPHGILREVDRVMMPEGRLVIVGFNPWSLWGLRSSVGLSRSQYPWNGQLRLPAAREGLAGAAGLRCLRRATRGLRAAFRQREGCAAASASWSPRATAGGPSAAPCTCCRPSSACAACACSRRRGRRREGRGQRKGSSRRGASARAQAVAHLKLVK